ncbi:MAG: membrane protein insertase YidC [Gemmatimonadota bacterium]
MSTEIRFLLAVVLMIAVLVITNLAFPPVPPEELPGYIPPDSVLATGPADSTATGIPGEVSQPPALESPGEEEPDPLMGMQEVPGAGVEPPQEAASASDVVVEGPLYAFTFSRRGARLRSTRLLDFPSFTFPDAVELIHPEGGEALGTRILVGRDTLDLRSVLFEAEPAEGLRLRQDSGLETLRFVYQHPTHPLRFEVAYTFHPDQYVVEAAGRVTGLDAQLIFTDLGTGIPFNEQREQDEERASAYVLNHLQEGIRSQALSRVHEDRVETGPFLWTAFKSKYFVVALLAGAAEEEEQYLGGVLVREAPGEYQVPLAVTQAVSGDGTFDFRLFLGPQEFARLSNLGTDMQNVNPYGWKFFRPIIRPVAAIVIRILGFLHENLSIGYGWVLILFGVMMRVVLFPLNQKGMKAQMRNMAAQPLMQEIQTKYKDNPEKLQKEMMKLYKEHGFNPLAGCLPMLLPWPVLIALFFVFQNTIELRGVPFLWLPDLSAPDPYFILPAFLGISMFLLQWVSMRTMPQQNPQMKMMMYIMPVMMVFIFFQLASGLNLYYATANIATLPQQIYIARERKKSQAKAPLTLSK